MSHSLTPRKARDVALSLRVGDRVRLDVPPAMRHYEGETGVVEDLPSPHPRRTTWPVKVRTERHLLTVGAQFLVKIEGE